MQGAQALTPEMDVYAFAICCVEILTKGSLPWPLADDDAVWRFVLSACLSKTSVSILPFVILQMRIRGRLCHHRVSPGVH